MKRSRPVRWLAYALLFALMTAQTVWESLSFLASTFWLQCGVWKAAVDINEARCR